MSEPSQPRWLTRACHAAAAALAGIILGFTTLWTGVLSPLALAAVVTAAGVLVALIKVPLPLITVSVASLLLTSTVVGQFSWSDSIVGFVFGLVYSFCFLIAALVVAVVRARRDFVRRGWDLAYAEAREHEARLARAVGREREAMASEVHDGLGHRLTLIAVQASRLSLDQRLPDHAREELGRIREHAAAASEELGETVRLLSEPGAGVPASLSGLRAADVVERARDSGLTVDAVVAPGAEAAVNDYTHAALLRGLQEGLTNAAKHAPGAPVAVTLDRDGDTAVLRVANPVADVPASPPGHGLAALRARAAILDGELTIDRGETFTLELRLPAAAAPAAGTAGAEPSRVGVLDAAAADAERGRRRATRRAWLVPAAMLLVLAVVAGGYFAYATIAAVLPPGRFAAIEVGDDQVTVLRGLPPVEMLDAPRSLQPEPPGATCHYYEAAISFMERVDVYRICFDQDRVVDTTRIAP